MSLFLITNNKKSTKIAEVEFLNLFSKAIPETFNLNNEVFLTYTPAFKNRIVKKKIKDGYIFGFGTFFTNEGFHENALDSIEDLDSYLKLQEKGLFGHYILLIEQKDCLYLVTDKIGMINVYHAEKDGFYYISNDLMMTSITSNNINLSEEGTKQFILTESSVGRYTIFNNVHRLGLGNMLRVTKDFLTEEKIYSFKPEKLTFDEYLDRIESYFKLLNNFDGKIAADMSGGLDTRLVASIGHRLISRLETNTNPNQFDGGIDKTLSPIVSKKLGLPLTLIPNKGDCKLEKNLMLHGFSVGRDILRSKQWPNRMKTKYGKYSFIIGGYGGETVRAKYNITNEIPELVKRYYKGAEAESFFRMKNYNNCVNTELNNYLFKELKINDQISNWIYTMDRMRIWGGSQVLMASLFGEILHPFMDWHLINPIFSWNVEELKESKLQKRIIINFAPQLKDVPINALEKKKNGFKEVKIRIKTTISKFDRIKIIIKRIQTLLLYKRTNKRTNKRLSNFYDTFSRDKINSEILRDINLDLIKLEKSGNLDAISRTATVIEASNYVRKFSN